MSDLSKGMYASVELVFQTIASQPQLQFPQAPFHPNIIYQNLSRYSPAARIPRTDFVNFTDHFVPLLLEPTASFRRSLRMSFSVQKRDQWEKNKSVEQSKAKRLNKR